MNTNINKIIKLINKANNDNERTDATVYDKYILMQALAEELKKECLLKIDYYDKRDRG